MDIACPLCQTTKYRNPKMKLMVSKCGHSLCETCVENKFSKGAGICPTCKIELKKAGFRYQIFEDSSVELEVDIRKGILKDFNLKEQDFGTIDAYNDYLEMVEDISKRCSNYFYRRKQLLSILSMSYKQDTLKIRVFNLTNKLDIEDTQRRIAEFKEMNKDQISRSRGKLSHDEMYIAHLIEQERTADEERKKIYEQELLKEQEAKQRVKTDLMEALLQSDANVSQVIKKSIEDIEKSRKDVQPIMPNMISGEEEIIFSLKNEQNQQRLFEYTAPHYDHQGPPVPDPNDLEQDGFLDHVRQEKPNERAGGYTRVYPCLRAVQEAFDMLLFVKEGLATNVKQEPRDDIEPMES